MRLVIDIPEELYNRFGYEYSEDNLISKYTNDAILEAFCNGTPLDDLLQRLRKRISDLYNTDVTYDNGDYNTMDSPTLDKVLEYFDSEVQE